MQKIEDIPMDWLEFQIEFALKNGFIRSADAFEFVKEVWKKTHELWLLDKEAFKKNIYTLDLSKGDQ